MARARPRIPHRCAAILLVALAACASESSAPANPDEIDDGAAATHDIDVPNSAADETADDVASSDTSTTDLRDDRVPLDELPPLSFALDGPTTIYDQDCYDLSRSLHGRSISDAKDALLQPDGPCAGRRFSEAPCSVFDIDVADRFFFGAEMIHLDDGEEPQDEYGFEVQLSNGDEVWAAGHSVPYQDSPGEAYNCFFDSGASSAPPSTVFVGR